MPGAVSAAKPVVPTKMETNKAGQNTLSSKLCIATQLNGKSCNEPRKWVHVPYCAKCVTNGDPSLDVVPHPTFGKMLVTKRTLPAGYRIGLWGEVQKDHEIPEPDAEWAFETSSGTESINPRKFQKGSQLQFSQCVGPHEKVTVCFNDPYLLMSEKKNGNFVEKMGCMMFKTSCEVKKGGQLNMMYAGGPKETDQFFEERGLTRCDVWTKNHPTVLKKGVAPKDLLLKPPAPKSEREAMEVLGQKKGAFKKGGASSSTAPKMGVKKTGTK